MFSNMVIATLCVAAAGLILLIGASSNLSRVRKLKSSLYSSNAYSRSQLQEIELAVLRGDDLPSDPRARETVLEWAREEASLGPRALRWQPFQFLGTAMIFVLVYLVPVFGLTIGIVVQAVLVVLGAITFMVGVRGSNRAKDLVERIDRQS